MKGTCDISELVGRAQNGDRESLGVLSARVRRRMFVYLYRMTLDYHLAEDLVQETVLYMIESLPRLETTSSLSLWAWIYRSAWGIFRHYIRPQGHQRIVQNTVVDHEALLQLTDDGEETALEHAERSELFEAICKSIGTLQTKQRNVLILRCFEQLSHAEIASVMGCSELKARVLFFHAKHALKRQLHNRGFGRRYFLTGVSLFGFITASRAKSASAAITVTSNLVKTETLAVTLGAVTAKLGLMKAAVAAIVLVAGAVHVCSSDADVPAELTTDAAVSQKENYYYSIPDRTGYIKPVVLSSYRPPADPALPDPCGYDPHNPITPLPLERIDREDQPPQANRTQTPLDIDQQTDPNEIKTRIESFDGLAEMIEDVNAAAESEQRRWAQTKYDNRVTLTGAVHRQIVDELSLIHKIAVEENAEKTVEAIDILITKEKDLYKALSRELLRQLKQTTATNTIRGRGRTRPTTRSSDRANALAEEPADFRTLEEIRRWTEATIGNKSKLARATHDRICREMDLIQSIAIEDSAMKTTAAIDGILMLRAERLDEFTKKTREQVSISSADHDLATNRYDDDTVRAGGRIRGRSSRTAKRGQ